MPMIFRSLCIGELGRAIGISDTPHKGGNISDSSNVPYAQVN